MFLDQIQKKHMVTLIETKFIQCNSGFIRVGAEIRFRFRIWQQALVHIHQVSEFACLAKVEQSCNCAALIISFIKKLNEFYIVKPLHNDSSIRKLKHNKKKLRIKCFVS